MKEAWPRALIGHVCGGEIRRVAEEVGPHIHVGNYRARQQSLLRFIWTSDFLRGADASCKRRVRADSRVEWVVAGRGAGVALLLHAQEHSGKIDAIAADLCEIAVVAVADAGMQVAW
jgi:hypothetical protein